MINYDKLVKEYQEDLRRALIEYGISFTEEDIKSAKPRWPSKEAVDFYNRYIKLPPERQRVIKKELYKLAAEQRKEIADKGNVYYLKS